MESVFCIKLKILITSGTTLSFYTTKNIMFNRRMIKTASLCFSSRFAFCFGVSNSNAWLCGFNFENFLAKDISKSALWTESYVVMIVIYAGIFLDRRFCASSKVSWMFSHKIKSLDCVSYTSGMKRDCQLCDENYGNIFKSRIVCRQIRRRSLNCDEHAF